MISAIIPYRNWSVERLERCIQSLEGYSCISEIIVIDFGSDNPPPTPGARLVSVAAKSWCLSEACNIGIAEATNDVILKVDCDITLDCPEDRFIGYTESIREGKFAAVNFLPTDFTKQGSGNADHRLRPRWCEGACLLMHRATVIDIGGFDTRFHGYGGEDNDLCGRLRRFGMTIRTVYEPFVLHERHQSSPDRILGTFSAEEKRRLLSEKSIFRQQPFKYSNYRNLAAFGPTVTVAIATSPRPGRREQLEQCLKSLERQTFKDFEVVICENGPSSKAFLDASLLQASFPDLDISVIFGHEKSIPKARNSITKAARGFYIAVFDDDDISLPDRLAEQVECVSSSDGAHGCHSAWLQFDERSGRVHPYTGQKRNLECFFQEPGKVTLHSTGFYRKDILLRFPYSEEMVLASDYELCVRQVIIGLNILHTGRYHVLRRLHRSSVSASGSDEQIKMSLEINQAFRFNVGEAYLTHRPSANPVPWASGLPMSLELPRYLPPEFGQFKLSMSMESAIEMGINFLDDEVYWPQVNNASQIALDVYVSRFGADTEFRVCCSDAFDAGDVTKVIDATPSEVLPYCEIVTNRRSNTPAVSVGDIRVQRGNRHILIGPYDDAIRAIKLANELTAQNVVSGNRVSFFAVTVPTVAIYLMISDFNNQAKIERALRVLRMDYHLMADAVGDRGVVGGFNEY